MQYISKPLMQCTCLLHRCTVCVLLMVNISEDYSDIYFMIRERNAAIPVLQVFSDLESWRRRTDSSFLILKSLKEEIRYILSNNLCSTSHVSHYIFFRRALSSSSRYLPTTEMLDLIFIRFFCIIHIWFAHEMPNWLEIWFFSRNSNLRYFNHCVANLNEPCATIYIINH